MVPEDTDGFGSLLCLQQGVLQGDGGVEDGRERWTLTVNRGAHDGCVDHWTVGEPGKKTHTCAFLRITHTSCTVDLKLVYIWSYSLLSFCQLSYHRNIFLVTFSPSHIKNT